MSSFLQLLCDNLMSLYLMTSPAWTPPPGCWVKYLSCIVLIYHRFDMSSYSSWKVSWSDISSWFAVTSTPEKVIQLWVSNLSFESNASCRSTTLSMTLYRGTSNSVDSKNKAPVLVWFQNHTKLSKFPDRMCFFRKINYILRKLEQI